MKVTSYFIWEVTLQGCMAALVSINTVCTGVDMNETSWKEKLLTDPV